MAICIFDHFCGAWIIFLCLISRVYVFFSKAFPTRASLPEFVDKPSPVKLANVMSPLDDNVFFASCECLYFILRAFSFRPRAARTFCLTSVSHGLDKTIPSFSLLFTLYSRVGGGSEKRDQTNGTYRRPHGHDFLHWQNVCSFDILRGIITLSSQKSTSKPKREKENKSSVKKSKDVSYFPRFNFVSSLFSCKIPFNFHFIPQSFHSTSFMIILWLFYDLVWFNFLDFLDFLILDFGFFLDFSNFFWIFCRKRRSLSPRSKTLLSLPKILFLFSSKSASSLLKQKVRLGSCFVSADFVKTHFVGWFWRYRYGGDLSRVRQSDARRRTAEKVSQSPLLRGPLRHGHTHIQCHHRPEDLHDGPGAAVDTADHRGRTARPQL